MNFNSVRRLQFCAAIMNGYHDKIGSQSDVVRLSPATHSSTSLAHVAQSNIEELSNPEQRFFYALMSPCFPRCHCSTSVSSNLYHDQLMSQIPLM